MSFRNRKNIEIRDGWVPIIDMMGYRDAFIDSLGAVGTRGHAKDLTASLLLLPSLQEDSVKEMSMSLGSIGAGIPGVRPGVATADFLRNARDSSRFLGKDGGLSLWKGLWNGFRKGRVLSRLSLATLRTLM